MLGTPGAQAAMGGSTAVTQECLLLAHVLAQWAQRCAAAALARPWLALVMAVAALNGVGHLGHTTFHPVTAADDAAIAAMVAAVMFVSDAASSPSHVHVAALTAALAT